MRHFDQGVRKIRQAIITTFNELFLNGRYAELGIRELARKAGVGRSTFYQHFDDKTALLVESLHPILSVIAEAAAGKNASELACVLAHFEEQRENALSLLRSASELTAIEGGLSNLIEQGLPRGGKLPVDAVAATLSRMTLGLIADWLVTDRRTSRDEFAVVLTTTALACRAALLA